MIMANNVSILSPITVRVIGIIANWPILVILDHIWTYLSISISQKTSTALDMRGDYSVLLRHLPSVFLIFWRMHLNTVTTYRTLFKDIRDKHFRCRKGKKKRKES